MCIEHQLYMQAKVTKNHICCTSHTHSLQPSEGARIQALNVSAILAGKIAARCANLLTFPYSDFDFCPGLDAIVSNYHFTAGLIANVVTGQEKKI